MTKELVTEQMLAMWQSKTESELVFFTDDDVFVPEDWVERLERWLIDRTGEWGGLIAQ